MGQVRLGAWDERTDRFNPAALHVARARLGRDVARFERERVRVARLRWKYGPGRLSSSTIRSAQLTAIVLGERALTRFQRFLGFCMLAGDFDRARAEHASALELAEHAALLVLDSGRPSSAIRLKRPKRKIRQRKNRKKR